MKLLNTIHEDYHIHSLNFSDGMNTIDEIAQYAGKMGMKKIAITDHSQKVLDRANITLKNRRPKMSERKNVHNDVEVIFGVEADLLDEEGNCCFDIQGVTSDFNILSCHKEDFKGDLKNITQAYINAIHKYHDKISFVGHLCKKDTSQYLDIDEVVDVLNQYQIPVEVNSFYLHYKGTDIEKLKTLLIRIEAGVYINSDMHMFSDSAWRQEAFDYLKEQGFLE